MARGKWIRKTFNAAEAARILEKADRLEPFGFTRYGAVKAAADFYGPYKGERGLSWDAHLEKIARWLTRKRAA